MASVSKLTKLVPALAIAVGFGAANPSQAADLLMDPPIMEAPEVVETSQGGWYLRGDITYDFHQANGATYYPAAEMFTDLRVDDSFDIGLGIGYQVTNNFRVDLTGEYVFAADWTGTSVDTNSICPDTYDAYGNYVDFNTVPGSCTGVNTARMSMFKVMGNAYYDIGHFAGFTPYIGAGIGGAYVMYDDFLQTDTSRDQCCGNQIGDEIVRSHVGRDSWRFAYAFHAGMSYDINHKVKFDLGYSYTDIGHGAIANYIDSDKPQAYDEGFTDHVIRAGLRYQIW